MLQTFLKVMSLLQILTETLPVLRLTVALLSHSEQILGKHTEQITTASFKYWNNIMKRPQLLSFSQILG